MYHLSIIHHLQFLSYSLSPIQYSCYIPYCLASMPIASALWNFYFHIFAAYIYITKSSKVGGYHGTLQLQHVKTILFDHVTPGRWRSQTTPTIPMYTLRLETSPRRVCSALNFWRSDSHDRGFVRAFPCHSSCALFYFTNCWSLVVVDVFTFEIDQSQLLYFRGVEMLLAINIFRQISWT